MSPRSRPRALRRPHDHLRLARDEDREDSFHALWSTAETLFDIKRDYAASIPLWERIAELAPNSLDAATARRYVLSPVVLESTAKGKTRQVTVYLKPGAKVVRFVRATEPGQTGFVEQAIALADLKPGWIVSVAARHEGDREVAELVKVVLER